MHAARCVISGYILFEAWGKKSNHTLAHHSAGDLLEACDVGTGNQVALHAITLGCIGSVLVDVDHDVVQALVNLFKGPGEAQAVLAHFQAGSSNAAGVGGKIKLDENGDAIKSIAFNTFVDGKVKWSETLDSDGNLVSSAE